MEKRTKITTAADLPTPVCRCGPDADCMVETILGIDERGQMVIPKEVRQKVGIAAGDRFALISWGKDGSVCCLALVRVETLNDAMKDLLGPVLANNKP